MPLDPTDESVGYSHSSGFADFCSKGVDATESKSESVVVTVVVRWPDCLRICDRSLNQTVQLS